MDIRLSCRLSSEQCGVKKLDVLNSASTPQSLVNVTHLGLWHCSISEAEFGQLLQACRKLSWLEMESVKGLTAKAFVNMLLRHQSSTKRLRRLEIDKSFIGSEPPTQSDYLKVFLNLTQAWFSGEVIAWDSLMYLGPRVTSLKLDRCPLSTLELAANLGQLVDDEGAGQEMTVILSNCRYTERQRAFLTVSRFSTTSVISLTQHRSLLKLV